MHFMRRTIVASLHSLFAVSLLSFGILLGIRMVFGTPDILKESLKTSGIYEVAAKELLSKNTQQIGNASADGLPTTDPKVQAAIEKAFPPETLEQNVSKMLDGTYGWLQGTSASPEFSIDLSSSRQRLSTELAAYAQTRLATLPACPAGTPVATIDPLKATCRPVNLDTADITEKVQAEIESQKLLSEQTLNADNVTNTQGETIPQQFQGAPQAYQWSLKTLYITAIVGLLAGAGAVLLHFSKREGLRRIGMTSVTTGLTIGAIALLSSFLVNKLAEQFADAAKGHELQAKLTQLLQLLLSEVRVWWLGYAIVVGIIGVILLVVLQITKPKPVDTTVPPQRPDTDSPLQTPPPPAPRPTSSPCASK